MSILGLTQRRISPSKTLEYTKITIRGWGSTVARGLVLEVAFDLERLVCRSHLQRLGFRV